jgi:hypothetical protein
MLFGKGGNSNINVNTEGVPIDIVKETKFLGILLDNRLTWKSHTAYISKKIAKSIGILSRARKLLNRETLRQLYFAFLYPYLNYCLIIWGNAPATTTFPIFKLQKRALRIVFNLKGRDSTQVACRNSKLLRLPELYTLSVLTFMYKFKNHLLPAIFNNFYQENSSFHRYPTRQSANLRNPRTRTKLASSFVKNTGVSIGNKFSHSLTHETKLGLYKSTSIELLIANYGD